MSSQATKIKRRALKREREKELKTIVRAALAITGSIGFPSKMPGTSYGISALRCIVGAKLAAIPGTTCHGCYALKGHYVHAGVKKAHETRFAALADPRWTGAMATALNGMHALGYWSGHKIAKGWHRWHDSGDLQSTEHLAKICAVAALTPQITHWLPTRENSILQAYIAQGGVVPANLTIRVSATKVDGRPTAQWPITSGVHHKEAPTAQHEKARVCPAPKQGNMCGKCRSCWSKDVAHVTYHKH